MRAVVCPRAPIPSSELVYTTNYPTPQPKPGHVLIRIKAYGLNRSELFTRQGRSPVARQGPGIQFPRVLGIECVGLVKDAGGSSKWKEGDAVAATLGGMGSLFDGGYAEYALIPEKNVSPPVRLPEGMEWAEFGAIPETFMTAWGILDRFSLQPTDTLLIRGGTTSVGLACASLAKSALFSKGEQKVTVVSTTRNVNKADKVKAAGADVVLIDKDNNIHDEVKKATGGRGANTVVELVGGPTLTDSCLSLAPDGVTVYVGCVSGEWVVKDFDPLTTLAPRKHLTMFGSFSVDLSTAPLQWIVDAVARGELSAGLDKVFKMEETGEAHAYMEANSATGKVVCLVD